MKREDRAKAQRLETIMAQHAERATANDVAALMALQNAGLTHVRTIPDAYERLETQRDFPGFTQAQIDMVIYSRRQPKAPAA